MNDLSEYSSDELRAELKKRSLAKRQKKLRDREWWIYQECTIVKIVKLKDKRGLDRFEYIMDQDYYYHNRANYRNGYRMSQGFGFKADNYPRLGDKVLMRRKNYRLQDRNIWAEYKICKVVERSGNIYGPQIMINK